MMFRPRWPSAGPIGGDGLALPAGTCSLTKPTIFFAMVFYSLRVIAPWLESLGSPGLTALFRNFRTELVSAKKGLRFFQPGKIPVRPVLRDQRWSPTHGPCSFRS